jgi:hypothetical protein
MDASGKGHATTPTNITYGQDRFGNATGAAWFNNTSANGTARITVTHQADLVPAAYTLSMWVKPSSNGYNSNQSWTVLLRKGIFFPYAMFLDKTNLKVQTGVYNGGAGTGDQILSVAPVQLNQWHHLAATYSSGTCRLYVNGVYVTETTQAGALPNNVENISIGSGSFSSIRSAFQGWMDDIKLHSEALDDAQVAILAGLQPNSFTSLATAAGLSGNDALPQATPHQDGVANLLKYAFNMDLSGPDIRGMVRGTGTAGLPDITSEPSVGPMKVFRFEFLRRISGEDHRPVLMTDIVPLTVELGWVVGDQKQSEKIRPGQCG